MKKLFLLLLACLITFSSYAQDWKADIEKAYSIFSSSNLEVEVEHLFYPSANASTSTEHETIWFCKMGDKYRLKQYGTEFICDGNYVVLVNENAGIVGINKKEKKDANVQENESFDILLKSIANLATSMGLDTLKQKEEYTCTYLGEHNGTKSYRFNYSYGEYKQSTVYLSTKTGFLERISCIFRQAVEVEPGMLSQPRIDFVYTKQVAGKNFDNNFFSIADIVSIDANGTATLKERYRNYHLLNNISK